MPHPTRSRVDPAVLIFAVAAIIIVSSFAIFAVVVTSQGYSVGTPQRAGVVVGAVIRDGDEMLVPVVVVNQGPATLEVSTGDFILVDNKGTTYVHRAPVAQVAAAQAAVPVQLSAKVPADRHLVALVVTLPDIDPITLKIEE